MRLHSIPMRPHCVLRLTWASSGGNPLNPIELMLLTSSALRVYRYGSGLGREQLCNPWQMPPTSSPITFGSRSTASILVPALRLITCSPEESDLPTLRAAIDELSHIERIAAFKSLILEALPSALVTNPFGFITHSYTCVMY